MTCRKMNINELCKVSGGWGITPWNLVEPVGRVAGSLWKHRRSYYAGYRDSPIH